MSWSPKVSVIIAKTSLNDKPFTNKYLITDLILSFKLLNFDNFIKYRNLSNHPIFYKLHLLQANKISILLRRSVKSKLLSTLELQNDLFDGSIKTDLYKSF